MLFARSTDGGVSFDRSFRVTPVEHGTGLFTDLAVGPDGTVWLTYLTYASSSRPTTDVWLLSSTDGGVSFGAPSTSRRSPGSTPTSSRAAPGRRLRRRAVRVSERLRLLAVLQQLGGRGR